MDLQFVLLLVVQFQNLLIPFGGRGVPEPSRPPRHARGAPVAPRVKMRGCAFHDRHRESGYFDELGSSSGWPWQPWFTPIRRPSCSRRWSSALCPRHLWPHSSVHHCTCRDVGVPGWHHSPWSLCVSAPHDFLWPPEEWGACALRYIWKAVLPTLKASSSIVLGLLSSRPCSLGLPLTTSWLGLALCGGSSFTRSSTKRPLSLWCGSCVTWPTAIPSSLGWPASLWCWPGMRFPRVAGMPWLPRGKESHLCRLVSGGRCLEPRKFSLLPEWWRRRVLRRPLFTRDAGVVSA